MNEQYYRVYLFFGLPCGFCSRGHLTTTTCGVETETYINAGKNYSNKKLVVDGKEYDFNKLLEDIEEEYQNKKTIFSSQLCID